MIFCTFLFRDVVHLLLDLFLETNVFHCLSLHLKINICLKRKMELKIDFTSLCFPFFWDLIPSCSCCRQSSPFTSNIFFFLFSQYFIIGIFRHKEKVTMLNNKQPYTHRTDSIIYIFSWLACFMSLLSVPLFIYLFYLLMHLKIC